MPQRRPDAHPEAFVTGGAYALLFLLGALQALIGSFQFSRALGTFPAAAAAFAVLILLTCLLGAAGMRSAAGALIPAIGWFVVSVAMTLPTPSGSVIVAGTTAGEVYLYGGSICAVVGVVIAFLHRGRQRTWTRAHRVLPRHEGS